MLVCGRTHVFLCSRFGSMRKRLGFDNEASGSSDVSSWIKSLHCKSKISSNDVVQGARAEASSHSCVSQDLKRLSNTKGGRNAQRSISRLYEKECKWSPCYYANTTLWKHKLQQPYSGRIACMPIHEVLHLVVDADNVSDVCSYDDGQQEFEACLTHTCHRLGTLRQGCAGLQLWGDFAKYHTRDSICLLLWSFLSGKSQTRYWLVALSKRQCCGCGCKHAHTFEPIWAIIAWMLRVVLSGKFPDTRHDGVRFSESQLPGDQWRVSMTSRRVPSTHELYE